MRTGSVRISDVWTEGRRLTGGFHLSEDQEAVRRITHFRGPTQPLHELAIPGGVFRGPIFKRIYVRDPERGVPYVSAKDLVQADIRPPSFLSHRLGPLIQKLTLEEGMILVTCSGMNLGRAIWTRRDMAGLCASHDLIRIRGNPEMAPPGYLYAFLASRYGRAIIRKHIYGGSIKHVEPRHIANLSIPRLRDGLELQAHELVMEAADLITLCRGRMSKATDRLFESVGLRDITAAEWHSEGPDLGFSERFPRVETFRALNFNPRFEGLCERIRQKYWRPLGKICEPGTLKRGGRFKSIDATPENAYQLIGQRQLFSVRPEGRWLARSTMRNDVLVKPGTILVAARGTLGETELYCRAEFAWGPAVDFAYSEDILRVVADEQVMPRGCLFAFMRSETAFRMLRSISVGTKIQDHHNVLISLLPVPYPRSEIRQSIQSLVTEAYDARYRAVALEREAADLVECAMKDGA